MSRVGSLAWKRAISLSKISRPIMKFTCRQCGGVILKRCNPEKPPHFGFPKFCSISCNTAYKNQHMSKERLNHLSERAYKLNHDPNHPFGKRRGRFVRDGEEWYHSRLEHRFVKAARELGIKVERNFNRFPYFWEGRKHYYTPDFKIYTPIVHYVEVKGWSKDKDYVKLDAVRKVGFPIHMIKARGVLNFGKGES